MFKAAFGGGAFGPAIAIQNGSDGTRISDATFGWGGGLKPPYRSNGTSLFDAAFKWGASSAPRKDLMVFLVGALRPPCNGSDGACLFEAEGPPPKDMMKPACLKLLLVGVCPRAPHGNLMEPALVRLTGLP